MIITGWGAWDPLIFLLLLIAITLIVYFIRCLGEDKCREEKDKTAPFFSGNIAPGKTRFINVYWGFFEALNRYYRWMKMIHNGIINDYIYWFILLVIIIGVVVLI